jgi:hypothetical protein
MLETVKVFLFLYNNVYCCSNYSFLIIFKLDCDVRSRLRFFKSYFYSLFKTDYYYKFSVTIYNSDKWNVNYSFFVLFSVILELGIFISVPYYGEHLFLVVISENGTLEQDARILFFRTTTSVIVHHNTKQNLF